MFFGLLNTKPENRAEIFAQNYWEMRLIPSAENIPYLNGGLFEQDENDEVRSVFPKELFSNPDFMDVPKLYIGDTFDYTKKRGLFDFFSAYNFTIDENDPDDAEVGVDPEMLGKIFESLLEDNKEKGAYYTKKEVVNYMCSEALIAYLQTEVATEAEKQTIREFVTQHDCSVFCNDESSLKTKIQHKLSNLKICDPAIGSGAFPMGLLAELCKCRKSLNPELKRVELKKEIIQNCIYGVDIEKGAIDIARLRFWLSLVVDEDVAQPLPNLDFKIMQGNSLLPTFNSEYVNITTDRRTNNEVSNYIKKKKEELQKLQLEYFDASGEKKDELAIKVKETILDIISKQIGFELKSWAEKQHKEGSLFQDTDAIESVSMKQLVKMLPEDKQEIARVGEEIRRKLQDKQIPLHERAQTDLQFFDWEIMFYDVFANGGFDIVIGNPPYISAPNQIKDVVLKKQREDIVSSKLYKTICEKWDLYIPFLENGICKLAKPNGIMTMIVPLPLTNQKYGKKLRPEIIDNHDLLTLVDGSGVKLFTNATVTNCIPLVRRSQSTAKQSLIVHVTKDIHFTSDYIKSHDALMHDRNTTVWNMDEVVDDANTSKRHPEMNVLGDYCYISKGMVLNADEKTAKGAFKKNDLICNTYDNIHCRKYIEAKDIEKYRVKKLQYLEYNTKRCPGQLSRPTFRELYEYPKLMVNRLGKMQVYYDEDKLLTSDSMFCSVLWKDLTHIQNKSISASIKRYSRLDRYSMENLSKGIDLKYLLAIMNSRYAVTLLSAIRGGDYHIYPEHIRNIPIAPATEEQQQEIIKKVDAILEAKKSDYPKDTSKKENEIDRIVYELYGLTNGEVRIIDPNISIKGKDSDLFKN